MKTYLVKATREYMVELHVKAESEDKAWELAEDYDIEKWSYVEKSECDELYDIYEEDDESIEPDLIQK